MFSYKSYKMKIGIHKGKGFSKQWIGYCKEKGIPYKIVDCYRSDITQELSECDALMWHFRHDDYRDVLFAEQLIVSLQAAGKNVFPDFNTCWHFDDKIGQKYLLESINAPLVPSFVFYSRLDALEWVEKTNFPKVFKLRNGAGASNVQLVKTERESRALIHKAFGSGVSQFNRFGYLKDRVSKYKTGKDTVWGVLKGVGRLFIPTDFSKMHCREKGYVYFQDYIPGNAFDLRVIVIGNKAYGMKRLVRKGDFRASGSQDFVYDPIDENVLKIAFDVSKKLGFQVMAFDFIYDQGKPLIIEMSCFFGTKGSGKTKGYYTSDLQWHPGSFNPIEWIIENLTQLPKETC